MDVEKVASPIDIHSASNRNLRSSTGSRAADSDEGSIKNNRRSDTDEGDTFDEKSIHVEYLPSTHVSGPVTLPIEVLHDGRDFVEGGLEGWLVVAGCFLIGAPTVGESVEQYPAALTEREFTFTGWNLLWGVFQAYHSAHLLKGTPDATISLIGASQNAMMAGVAFVSGKLGDRYGYKCFIVVGCVMVFASQLSAAWCKHFWSIFITQGVLQGLGCGLTLPMVFALPSQWFKRRRGLATGIVIAGAALGGAVSSLIVQAMLLRMSLHMTLLIYSFVQGGILLAGCLLIKARPPASASEPKKIRWVDSVYFKDPVFWSCWLALALFVLGYQIPFIFISVYIGETMPSISPQLASLPISIMNFSSAVGRTTVGLVADQIGFVNAFILTATISAFSQAVLWNLTTHTYAGAIVFSIIFGLTGPCYVSLTTPIAATLYGTQSLATLTGLLNISSLPGMN
ncbi:putative transporter MCH2 [Saccharomyces cerevisiae S288c] [Rhizoctonia solani]|uniref:Putative transporter MCH2 [Saccharomyces cerevisiae S288c] n=1 Tax=Rhizoctonia solani TaxID=456999 RepID=A0A0K6FYY2_9AGAM|nr:putative transporter MCH2 [Saccharomyces cerevisiae S288c] [Rhizoctonia solani]